MRFEDTRLPEDRATRIAFEKAVFQVNVANRGRPKPYQDSGMGPGSLKLFVRAGEILAETVPGAAAEQVAGAVLFLNLGFQRPALIQRAHSRDLPDVCGWAQEWADIQKGRKALKRASLELRQIIIAVNVAIMEGMKNNLPVLGIVEARKDLAEKTRMARQTGSLGAPLLEAKFDALRGELKQLLDMQPEQGESRRRRLSL